MKQIDFSRFKNESFYKKLREYTFGPIEEHLGFVFFGGTGAVGGQTVIETARSFEYMVSVRPEWAQTRPRFIITGISRAEIDRFIQKLSRIFSALGRGEFEQSPGKRGAEVVLRRPSGLQMEFYILRAKPEFQNNLHELVEGKSPEEAGKILNREAAQLTSPFLGFMRAYLQDNELDSSFRFRSVMSGIPIPSVATYHFNEIDKILNSCGVTKIDKTKDIERGIKSRILHGIANDFGKIKQELAEEVLMAHTTSVGGMYTIEDGRPIIRLGYAHSALASLLLEKQFFANTLTTKYSELGLKVLIAAAAIGIDQIAQDVVLPMTSEIRYKFGLSQEAGHLPFSKKILEERLNRVFTPHVLGVSSDEESKQLVFSSGAEDSAPIQASFGLRSGENGIFSVDNAFALYLNMKVATQEELAHILAFNALLGDDSQKPWFDKDNICYHKETDNSIFAFSLLTNRAEFRQYQVSGFTPKAFQDLGSSKHQAELHTIGLYILLHRLNSIDPMIIAKGIRSKYNPHEAAEFLDQNTPPLTIEKIIQYDAHQLAAQFTKLLTLRNKKDLADLMSFNSDMSNPFIETFFEALLESVQRAIHTITSLGSPIVFNQDGETRVISGPYCAPINSVISHQNTLSDYIDKGSKEYLLERNDFFEWLIANNGFVDLRPQATLVTAKTHENGLRGMVRISDNIAEFRKEATNLQEHYRRSQKNHYGHMASSGVCAFVGRMIGLSEQLDSFTLSLGTLNTWKSLFPVDSNQNHPLIPGIVEAMRMYHEGLGKVTGFEHLYPGFGYFLNK